MNSVCPVKKKNLFDTSVLWKSEQTPDSEAENDKNDLKQPL